MYCLDLKKIDLVFENLEDYNVTKKTKVLYSWSQKTTKRKKHINLFLTYKRIGLRSLNKYVALQNVSTY